MDVELIEIRDFIAACPPFDHLPIEVLESLPRQMAVRYLRRGSSFPPDPELAAALWLIRTGAVEFRDLQQGLLEKLGEGDLLVDPCIADATLPYKSGKVVEDSLFYLLPCAILEQLRNQYAEFNRHFEQDLRLHLQNAIMHLQQQRDNRVNLIPMEVGTLLRRGPITVSSQHTIRQSAQYMSANKVSSLLVLEDGKLAGIVTDRDLRERAIAAGIDMERQIGEIMSRNLYTLKDTAATYEAQILMTRQHIHHVPIVDSHGDLKGIISASDILQQYNLNTMTLARMIHACKHVNEIVVISQKLPELQAQLINSGMSANQLTQALSTVIDQISIRLLQLAEQQFGTPPVPYAWIVCGSQARREQTTLSDQDNALLLDDNYNDQHQDYFRQLATFVSDGLARCGFAYCPGNVMATNTSWRQARKVWRDYFTKWINNPEPKALMHASIFFDMRALHGDQSLFSDLQQDVLQQCQNNTIFLAYMAANALQYRPPLGFFRQFVLIHNGEHQHTFDIKRNGLIPVVDMVRVYALAAGLPAINTRERLLSGEASGALSHAGAEELLHAYEFIATLRARHQVRQYLDGLPMDNYLSPAMLDRHQRVRLKDAFAAIRSMQQALEQRYQASRLT